MSQFGFFVFKFWEAVAPNSLSLMCWLFLIFMTDETDHWINDLFLCKKELMSTEWYALISLEQCRSMFLYLINSFDCEANHEWKYWFCISKSSRMLSSGCAGMLLILLILYEFRIFFLCFIVYHYKEDTFCVFYLLKRNCSVDFGSDLAYESVGCGIVPRFKPHKKLVLELLSFIIVLLSTWQNPNVSMMHQLTTLFDLACLREIENLYLQDLGCSLLVVTSHPFTPILIGYLCVDST